MRITIGTIIFLFAWAVASARRGSESQNMTTKKLLDDNIHMTYLHEQCKDEGTFFESNVQKINVKNLKEAFECPEGPVEWIRFLPPSNPLYVINRQEKRRLMNLMGIKLHPLRTNLALEVFVRKQAESRKIENSVLPLIDCGYNEDYFYFLTPKYTPLSQAIRTLSSLTSQQIARVFLAITHTHKILNENNIFHNNININSVYFPTLNFEGLLRPVAGTFFEAYVGDHAFEEPSVIALLLDVYGQIKTLKYPTKSRIATDEENNFTKIYSILKKYQDSHSADSKGYDKIENGLGTL